MKPTTGTLAMEQELRQANEQIRQLEHEAAEKKELAEKRVAELKEQGKNPLLDKELFSEIDELYKAADGPAQNASEIRERADELMQHLASRSSDSTKRDRMIRGMSAVEAIMSTPEYRRLAETGAFQSGGSKIELPGVEVASREQVVKAFRNHQPLMAATVDGEPLIAEDMRLYPPVPIPVRAIRVLDLITMSTTDSDKVDYVKETTRTDAAAETAKGTAYSEATYVYTREEAVVRDIGHFVPAHRSNLADQGQLQGLLEGRLQSGVERRLESQIVSGNGAGENLRGILDTVGIGYVDRDTTNSERLLEAIHRGITAVRLSLFDEPDAIGLHPSSYEDIVFEKDTNTGQYLLGPASQATSRTVWGFPAVVSSVFPDGTALVGQFRTGAIAWMRAGVSVRASDSHEDFFTKRMVALLAELRCAFAAWQPKAFCEVHLV
jgi:HK97 family phage major capsid protein